MSVAQRKQTQSVAIGLVSLSPLLFIAQLASVLGTSNLQVLGAVQIAIMLAVRFILGGGRTTAELDPVGVQVKVEEVTVQVEEVQIGGGQRRKKSRKVTQPAPPSLYPPALLDSITANFLSITEPQYLPLLPPSTTSIVLPSSVPLAQWKALLDTPTLRVLQHPTTSTLYAIVSVFTDLPIRSLFETLTDVPKRLEWDGMCCGSESIEEFECGGRRGSSSWLGMSRVGPIKAKDMVLLSVAGRLPSPPTAEGERAPLRLFAATSSFDHPAKPTTSSYNRMLLGVSGFLVEEVGENGSSYTQITDLSSLGSWTPSAVVRTITQTLIPKSLRKLGEVASNFNVATSAAPAEGLEWLPPLLGTSDDSTVASDESEEDEEEDYESESEEELPQSKGIITNDIASLLSQLRTLTTRLASLESTVAPPKPTNGNSWIKTLLAGESATTALASAGGAVGAATIVAILAVWGRGKR